jgi:carboxymethylenebutenolidase
MLATRLPELAAAVPFYGSQPKTEDVPRIKAPLLIHYAENDERINAGTAAYEAALKANHVKYQMFTYPGTQHGFNNDTTPRYDKAAAGLAWQRTIEFLEEPRLRRPPQSFRCTLLLELHPAGDADRRTLPRHHPPHVRL